jgi:hypothetical protein
MKRNISTIICLAVFLCAGPARGDGAIGLIMDGHNEGCTVKRGNGTTLKCRYNLELYAGDRIIKTPDASAVIIQWLAPPYTKAVTVDKSTLLIVSDRPEDRKSLIAWLGDALSFVKKTPHRSTIMATRGGDPSESCRNIITPLPGYGATLLSGLPARFAWCGKGKMILFKEGDGKVIYRASVEGKSEIPLTPEEIGLKPGITYTWEIEGIDSDEVYQVRLIGKELGDMVQRDLAEIDGSEAIETNEKAIRKAVYLQMVSDLYPKEADLYWQSIPFLGGDSDGIAESLRTRFAQHLQKTVRFK